MSGCYAQEIALLSIDQAGHEQRDYYRNRLADYVMVLHLWETLPEELLKLFLRHAPDTVRRHAMAFVGNQVTKPDQSQEVRARGLKYWELRLAEAGESADHDRYRQEIGQIGSWCHHANIDPVWFCDQLIQMLKAGFVPSNGYMVVDWLAKVLPVHVDRSVAVLAALLRHPRTDRWTFVRRSPIHTILGQGLAHGTPATAERVRETVSYLASIGESTYLDLLRPAEGG